MYTRAHVATHRSNPPSEEGSSEPDLVRTRGETSIPVAGVLGLFVLLEIIAAVLAS